MIATQEFSGTIFLGPQKNVLCTYGARYECAPKHSVHHHHPPPRFLKGGDRWSSKSLEGEMKNFIFKWGRG